MITNQLNDYLRKDYRQWKERPYLYETKDGTEQMETFGSFIEKTVWLAHYLLEKGWGGKNIGIFSPNSIRWMIADIAVMNYVGISVGFSKEWTYDNVAYALQKCSVDCLFYSDSYGELIDRLKARFPKIVFLSMEQDFDRCIEEGKALTETLSGLPVKSNDEPAKIVFTSGSTSFPKAVVLCIRNVFSGVASLGRRVDLNENDVCYLFLPLHHTYGSIYNFIYSLVFGFTVHLAENTKEMPQEMSRIHPTVFSAVPLVYMRFAQAAQSLAVPLKMLLGGQMKYLFCGGAVLDPALKQKYRSEGMKMMNAYALSETSSAFSIDYPDDDNNDSVGTVFEDIDVKVMAPDEDGCGELAVKGDNVFLGYYHDEAATKAAFTQDGYFLTGDIGCLVDQRVYLRGRKDTMITLPNGENISPAAVAEKVRQMNDTIKAVKVYVQNDWLTCDIYIDTAQTTLTDADWDAMMERLNQQLPKYEQMTKYHILDVGQLLKA
ncbi:MAG: AMP-binding protein [Clostridia bacterium]|nr:AMP-binding protein [Clostridia bacterium]